ncbi:glycosyltransferase family 4 protein [Kribbella speibonae]|uniref:Glycosyltransferase family 1 protein n=1 Tax=Kribbella speibonae TaxID=1572660 RepID=A0A4R0IT05_9ACTN|nr:glycosyltransferase family 4 protein [Kribbella speibonae]TCC36319.1 glycosyltransferase family 1 protein [Kribbella speibonae]
MRVLTVATDYPPNAFGGAGFYAAEITRELRALGVHVDVLSTRPGVDRIHADSSALKYPTSPAPGWDGVSVLTDNIALTATLARIASHYDVVNFHDVYSAIAPLAVRCANPKTAFILTKHTGPTGPDGTTTGTSGPIEDYMLGNLNDLEDWIFRSADGVICVAEQMLDRARTLYGDDVPARHIICPPAVNQGIFAGPDTPEWHWCSHDQRLLVPGRLSPRKGGDTVIEALTLVERDDTCITFVGSGPHEQALVDLAQRLGIQQRVHFLGKVTQQELAGLYSIATVVVAPSYVEAYGMVIGEARVSGAALVASDIPGHAEQMCDGVDGLMFSSEDSGDLARVLEKALATPDLIDSIASAGRSRAARHTWAKAARSSLDFFESVARSKFSQA